jgi:hypothetical protein
MKTKAPTKPMVFRIGTAAAPSSRRDPAAEKAIALLDALPLGEMLTAAQLAGLLNYNVTYLGRISSLTDWKGRRIIVSNRALYGQAQTITAYRAHLGL